MCIYCSSRQKNRQLEKERAEKRERGAELRAKEIKLQLALISANSTLITIVAEAVKKGYYNGESDREIDRGLELVKNANKLYTDFISEVAIADINQK
jgi:hypothetical protein